MTGGVAMKNEKIIELKISEDLLNKVEYLCEKENRSFNNHVLLLLRNSVAYFEKNHGKINVSAKKP